MPISCCDPTSRTSAGDTSREDAFALPCCTAPWISRIVRPPPPHRFLPALDFRASHELGNDSIHIIFYTCAFSDSPLSPLYHRSYPFAFWRRKWNVFAVGKEPSLRNTHVYFLQNLAPITLVLFRFAFLESLFGLDAIDRSSGLAWLRRHGSSLWLAHDIGGLVGCCEH